MNEMRSAIERATLDRHPGKQALVTDYQRCEKHFAKIAELRREVREAPTAMMRRAAQVELEMLSLESRTVAENMAVLEKAMRRHLL
jgi:hypothetical protein